MPPAWRIAEMVLLALVALLTFLLLISYLVGLCQRRRAPRWVPPVWLSHDGVAAMPWYAGAAGPTVRSRQAAPLPGPMAWARDV